MGYVKYAFRGVEGYIVVPGRGVGTYARSFFQASIKPENIYTIYKEGYTIEKKEDGVLYGVCCL